MKKFQIIYDKNKELDAMFDKEYDNTKEDIILKNKLELLVELGELANETKCFKYWSKKTPNKEAVLEEYADCLLMILLFFNMLNISLESTFNNENDLDLIKEFIYLFNISSTLEENFNEETLKNIFVNFIRLGHLLEFTDEEIINASLNKIKINFERFNIDY